MFVSRHGHTYKLVIIYVVQLVIYQVHKFYIDTDKFINLAETDISNNYIIRQGRNGIRCFVLPAKKIIGFAVLYVQRGRNMFGVASYIPLQPEISADYRDAAGRNSFLELPGYGGRIPCRKEQFACGRSHVLIAR